VRLRHGERVEDLGQFAGFDLVVAADGVNSVVRGQMTEAFGTRSHFLGNKFAWYGVGHAMRPNALVFRHTHGGVFVAHYYAYTPAMSTFVAECDAQTWTDCGLEAMSDANRRAMMEEIFAAELDGAPLIDNKSAWRNFNAVTNQHWVNGNVTVLGDALLSAHFSIGSGTRLAMDDAAALHAAIVEVGEDVPAALTRYVEIRRPIRDQFGAAAERSFMWYENIRAAMRAPVMDFTYDFLTRTGRVDDERLRDYAPAFYRDYQDYKGRQSQEVGQWTA
jgi:2-polyprenyl-6-methoxyphenol hydroxylase-like FAD-dependent oxidoreductase